MRINVDKVETKPYRPLFSRAEISITVVEVTIPEHNISLSLSHREDDRPKGYYVDTYIQNGHVHFCHGEGDRTVSKQVADGELLAAILDAV